MTKGQLNTKMNHQGKKEFSLVDIMAKLCSIEESQNKKIDDLKLTLEELMQKQHQLQKDFDSLVKTSNDHSNNLEKLEKTVEENTSNIKNIYNAIDLMEHKVNTVFQQKLARNLIINGIPKEPNEVIGEVISSIFTNMGMNVAESDIEESWRIHDRNLSPPVIVKLKNKSIKDMILKLRKQTNLKGQIKGKSMYAKDFGFDSENQIYINEELTQETRYLFSAAKKQLKEQADFKYVWVSEGKILARKNENEKVLNIRGNCDILDIIKPVDNGTV